MIEAFIIWSLIVGHAHLVDFHVQAAKGDRAAHAARMMCLNDYEPACTELFAKNEKDVPS